MAAAERSSRPAAWQTLNLFDHLESVQHDDVNAVVEDVIGGDIIINFAGMKFRHHAIAQYRYGMIDAACKGGCLSFSQFHQRGEVIY